MGAAAFLCLLSFGLTARMGAQTTLNFEAASCSPIGTGATVSTAKDPNVVGGLLTFLNSTAVGKSITFTTPSIPAGTYQAQFRYKTNTSRAQHNVKIDGTQIGGTIDQYAKTQTYPTATLGTVTFATAGTHSIVLTVTGKDAAATHFYISADKFTFVGQGTIPVAAPVFSPGGGTYATAQSVSITSATSSALIRYTTDGSTPSETVGTSYSGPVHISTTITLQAIAYGPGLGDSSITSATYTISVPPLQVVAPVFSPPGGVYTSAQNVSITSATSGATIRYTTDGSTPSETAGTIGTVVNISATTTLNAIAYKAGMTDSTVTSETYTISSGNIVTLFDGVDLNGWTQKPLNSWTVNTTDVAMASLGVGRGFIYSNNSYLYYRLRFTMRHISGNPDHQACVLIFGISPTLDALGGIQFQVPNGGHWDYRPGKNTSGGSEFTSLPHTKFVVSEWSSIELLVDGRNGTARMAVAQPAGSKAVEVLDFKDPTAARTGPFAWQMHNSGLFDEYKDVTIEVNPAVDGLITTQ
jgi:hypothetical protein